MTRHTRNTGRLIAIAIVLTLLALPVTVFACTELYVGSEWTEDGSMLFGRIEDYASDYAKLFNLYPAGFHRKGEKYCGCYGFTWTFTHDSYSFTGFSDDNSQGVCPDCDGTHPHTPYQAGGTNEKGLSVTATETLFDNEAVTQVDPYVENGIEEAEIATILLSEAASAKEAMLLLTSIIRTSGANGGAGVLVCDREESWYIENLSGTQYVAVRLNPELVLFNPNVSVIGSIDLDDTDQIVASEALIETAVAANCFVGDRENNVIDFAASYESEFDYSRGSRLAAGLNYLTGTEKYRVDDEGRGIDRVEYTATNLDPAGNLTALHTDIRLQNKLRLQDAIGLFRTAPIARVKNVETHLFQINPADETAMGTVEWVAMGNNSSSVFIPCFPMAVTAVHPSYKAGHSLAEHVAEEPDAGTCFDAGGEYVVFPEGWRDSMYWSFEALSHISERNPSAAEKITVARDRMQAEVFEAWERTRSEATEADPDGTDDSAGGSFSIALNIYSQAQALLDELLPASAQ